MSEIWTEERLQERLRKFHTSDYTWQHMENIPHFASRRKAAVLIPLVLRDGKIHVWLTKRAAHLRNDPGDVAFPGGMRDPEDKDETDTCLREAHEEIGLQRHQVKIIAQLLPMINRRGIAMTSIVGIVDDTFAPICNPEEVEDAFCPPLERFLSSTNHRSKHLAKSVIWIYMHWFTDIVGEKTFVTWGITSYICLQVAMMILQKEPEFDWNANGINDVQDVIVMQKQNIELMISREKVKSSI